jgi:hypothetical protein
MADDWISRTDLTLSFDAEEVPLRSLLAGGRAFNRLLREVSRAYLGTEQDPAQWLVHVEAGSVLLPVRPEPAGDAVSASKLGEVASVVAEGLAAIANEAERPPFFTDRALEQARELAKIADDDVPIAVGNGTVRTAVTARLIANVDEVLGPDEETIGTIEGALEELNVHGGSKRFGVYDALTGVRVNCHLTANVTLDDLRPAIGMRVAVRGPIRSRPDGHPTRIDAEEIQVFPAEEDLPSPDDVRGILSGYEVDE